ncbi:hypothetical protein Desor_0570 [Desulfosporosinus orientis DSM 765]|uniref:Transcriptional regulator n=1 Tax=Desulfosporosinus orientis (strain ATCC 19365 / DSM 765 / NCIMB 8382 / VKM B-1628 / Singapore I) TaxID=768706 RepID=G7WCE9_DESOD|nr:hypothetical protein [Desulfosporosinus orientis]AET66271.1 hypothetical protein Desor_0570 [Desulfosporosinus orientis DSM 765]
MKKLPVKFRVVEVISEHNGVSNEEIFNMLKDEYPTDRNVNDEGIDDYLLSLKSVGLIEVTSVTLDDNGKLRHCYKITDYGTNRMKYICK